MTSALVPLAQFATGALFTHLVRSASDEKLQACIKKTITQDKCSYVTLSSLISTATSIVNSKLVGGSFMAAGAYLGSFCHPLFEEKQQSEDYSAANKQVKEFNAQILGVTSGAAIYSVGLWVLAGSAWGLPDQALLAINALNLSPHLLQRLL